MVEIGNDAVADIADAGRQQREAAGRHVNDLARKLAPVGQHVAAKQVHLHALEAAALLGGRKRRLFMHERHLRHPTAGIAVD